MCLTFPYLAQSLTTFKTKMQDMNLVWTNNASKRKIEQFNFSIGFQMLKI